MNAPVLFIPENYYTVDNKSVLILDLGTIRIDSRIVDVIEGKDYTQCANPFELYDSYNFELKDF